MAHVADVQEIEASVGERDSASGRPVAGDGFDELWFRENLSQLSASSLAFWAPEPHVSTLPTSLRRPFLRPVFERGIVVALDGGAQLAW